MLKILIITPITGILINYIYSAYKRYQGLNKETLWIEKIGLIISIISMYISFYILLSYNNNSNEYQYREIIELYNNDINIYNITLGIDGLSIILIVLISITIPILIKLKDPINNDSLLRINNILIMQSILYITFCVIDIFGFFIMFELVLIPLYIFIIKYGSSKNIEAAIRLIVYSLFGSLLMLIGIIILYIKYGTTNLEILIPSVNNDTLSFFLIKILFIFFIIPFLIKVPSIPFHTWLPEAHSESPTIGSIILAGIILKLGTYGILRYINTIFINIKDYYSTIIILIAIISIIYGSLSTLRQIDIKKIIAYSSIVHMNYGLIGMFSNAPGGEGIEGTIYLMISHALISSNLFILIGILYIRYHKRILLYYRGLTITMPLFSSFFFFTSLANMSLPGLSSFVSEILIIISSLKYNIYVCILISFSIIFSTAYTIWLNNRILFGQISPYLFRFKDISLNEFLILLPFSFLTVLFGINTNSILNILYLYVFLTF